MTKESSMRLKKTFFILLADLTHPSKVTIPDKPFD